MACFRTHLCRKFARFKHQQIRVPISWMCKKQTAVSHHSAERDIISVDAGLRLEGPPALQLSPSHASGNLQRPRRTRHSLSQSVDNLSFYMVRPTFQRELIFPARPYVFEDNETFICMIIEGHSPNSRQVSQETQREKRPLQRKATLKLCGRGSETRLPTLPSRAAEEHLNEGSDRVQLPELSVHLGRPRWESGDFRRRGKLFAPRSTFRATPKRNVEHREFHLAQSLLLIATHSNVPTLRLLHSREGAGVLNVRFFPDARSLRMSRSTRSNPHKDVSSNALLAVFD